MSDSFRLVPKPDLVTSVNDTLDALICGPSMRSARAASKGGIKLLSKDTTETEAREAARNEIICNRPANKVTYLANGDLRILANTAANEKLENEIIVETVGCQRDFIEAKPSSSASNHCASRSTASATALRTTKGCKSCK